MKSDLFLFACLNIVNKEFLVRLLISWSKVIALCSIGNIFISTYISIYIYLTRWQYRLYMDIYWILMQHCPLTKVSFLYTNVMLRKLIIKRIPAKGNSKKLKNSHKTVLTSSRDLVIRHYQHLKHKPMFQ